MPFYEYRCTKCGEEFEELVSMGNYDPQCCPTCGNLSPKIMSTPNFSMQAWKPGYDAMAKEAMGVADADLVNKYKGAGADFGK